MLTPRQRVYNALYGEKTDKVPFTVYENKIEPCTLERELRNSGMCIVKRILSYDIIQKNVVIKSVSLKNADGILENRIMYETPYGELTEAEQFNNGTWWKKEYLFKDENDYKKLAYLYNDSYVIPQYERVIELENKLGEDFLVRDSILADPMHRLITEFMGIETYCIQWMENRDEVLKLYYSLLELTRKIFPVVANSPIKTVNFGGNIMPEIIGRDNFKKYFMPHYEEAGYLLHKRGKLMGTHMDGNNGMILDLLGETSYDYIEAYDISMSPGLKEAKEKLGDKSIWVNWPSGNHLDSKENMIKITNNMLEEMRDNPRFIIGITENVPPGRWQVLYKAIMTAIDEWAIRA